MAIVQVAIDDDDGVLVNRQRRVFQIETGMIAPVKAYLTARERRQPTIAHF